MSAPSAQRLAPRDRSGCGRRAVETIAQFTGKPPRSWESPGLTETEETIDLLRLNGIEYLADWVIELGPQGGAAGGELIAEGTPQQIMGIESSITRLYM